MVINKESLYTETRRLLDRYSLRARKGLAQHFLTNREILHKITEAAELTREDIIMEIGPGLGVLTRELVAKAGWVIAVELDKKLAAILHETLSPASNYAIVNRDILDLEPGRLLEGLRSGIPAKLTQSGIRYKVVANLPYYITSSVLRHILEASIKPMFIVIMVQKEIAQTVAAPPGEMSLLSVSVQFYGKPRVVTYVPAHCFYPPPKVESAVLRIDLYPKPAVDVSDETAFFRLVRAGFKSNRKQLINSLSQGLQLPKNDILPFLESAGIDPKRRAETLDLEEWAKLYHVCTEGGKC